MPKKGYQQSAEHKLKRFANFSGANHPNWKGGKYETSDGYIFIYSPNHPHRTKMGYVMEHRLVMEKHLGKILDSSEVVHHINHQTNDNRLENLTLMTRFNHNSAHHQGKRDGLRGKYIYTNL